MHESELKNATEQHGASQDHGIGTETVHKRAGKEKQSRFSLYLSGEQGKWMLGCCL